MLRNNKELKGKEKRKASQGNKVTQQAKVDNCGKFETKDSEIYC